MGDQSGVIRQWKKKLDEIVQLAKHIQSVDRKAAVILWFASFKQIQSIWNHVSPSQQVKANTKVLLTEDVSAQEPARQRKRKKKATEDSDNDIAASKKRVKLFDLKDFGIAYKEKEEKTEDDTYSVELDVENIKQEQEGVETNEKETIYENTPVRGNTPFGGNINIGGTTAEVQSVHLMISADPLLKNSATKLRRPEKTEPADKVKTIYPCKICEKQLYSHAELQKHKLTHDDTHCIVCHQKLSSASNLKAHMKVHFEERLYKCPECPATFKIKGSLWRHQASHSGEKPWSCDVCGKNYTEKSSLKVHYRTHTREKPFAQRSHLVTHRRRHQGIRPYACTECDSKFTTKGDYDRHLRTHTGERPHHCDVCGSSFTRLQTLQEHKNRHYNFKPYLCKICGKSFYELSACSCHVKSAHTAEGDTPPTMGNIIRFSSSSSDQGEVVKKGLYVTQIIAENDTDGKILEDGNNEFCIENNEGMHVVNNDVDEEERCELLVVNGEKDMEIIGAPAEQVAIIGNKRQNQNSEIICEGCGAVFTTWRGLRGHSRYKCCKVKKNGEKDTESNPCVSTTITARIPGVPVTQWLAEHAASFTSRTENIEVIESNKSNIEATGETIESIEFIQEVEETDIGHAVSIDEDGSITTVPFSQLAPIHIQLENEYMVVLSDGTKVQEETSTFAPHDMQQVEIEDQSHTITQEENDKQSITLVLNP